MEIVEQSIVTELQASGRLPSPTGVALTILDLCRDPDTSTEDLAVVLRGDPALTGQIIKYANSADAGSRQAITSTNDALVRLGMSMIRQLCLGFSVLSNARQGPCANFDYTRYWARSLARATACQALAKRLPWVNPDEGFTCGLLGDIGELGLASVYPEEYEAVLDRWDSIDSGRLCRLENEALSIDHNQVSAALFADWGLPEFYQVAVVNQENDCWDRDVAAADGQDRGMRLACLLNVADKAAGICLDDSAARHGKVLGFVGVCRNLGFDEDACVDLYDEILTEWERMGKVLDVVTSKLPPMDKLIARARQYKSGGSTDVIDDLALKCDSPEDGVDDSAEGDPDELPRADRVDAGEAGLEILVACDNPVDARILKKKLNELGHSLTICRDGHEALEQALQIRPQLILTDWVLPTMDGLELCQTLRSSDLAGDIYTIVMTTKDTGDDVVHAFDAGIDDYVTKPVNQRILTARLRAATRIIRLQEQAAADRDEINRMIRKLSIANRQLSQMALEDQLTALPNRRAGLSRLEQDWSRATRGGESLLVMLMDIDHFKRVNDTYGHDAGDVVLRETAAVMKRTMRTSDTVCRFGGEEFLVVCPGADVEMAKVLGDRIRRAIEQNVIDVPEFQGNVTISIGVAIRTRDVDSPKDLIKEADEALYAAKEAGRNKVCIANPE